VKFDRLKLSNFKCYRDADLRLDRGVTVIHGVNGSGKSSLLEACFFALYGAKALDDRTLQDVVTIGADDAEIELWFTHGGRSYHLERRVRVTNDRAQTATCVLETPDETIDGARPVRSFVADLLRMDADAFVNCAYVRQGEVNELIHATPAERQDIIDDLLQLGALETYRDRAGDARLAVDDVLGSEQAKLEQIEQKIDERTDQQLYQQLNDLETDKAEVEADIERIDAQQETAEETLQEAQQLLDEHEQRREQRAELAETIADLEAKIEATETEREELKSQLSTQRERREDLVDRRRELCSEVGLDEATSDAVAEALATLDAEDEQLRNDLEDHRLAVQRHEDEAETARTRAEELETKAGETREEIEALEAEIEAATEALTETREQRAELDEQLSEQRAVFEDAPVEPGDAQTHRERLADEREELTEELTDLRTERETLRDRIERADELLDEGNCPRCGQPVDGSPHVEAVEADRAQYEELESRLETLEAEREAIDDRIERADELVDAERELERLRERKQTAAQLLDEREQAIEDKRDRVAERKAHESDVEANAAEARDTAAEAAEAATERRGAIAEVNEQRSELRERRETLDRLQTVLDDIEAADEAIDRLRERRELLAEQNDERREALVTHRERKAELDAAIDEDRIETAREDRDRAETYIEQALAELDRLRERRDELQEQIGGVREALDELERLREQREELTERRDALESLHEESSQLESMYGDLRAELRRQNVDVLERLLNETFELVYRNDAYDRIELSAEYELTVSQKDGTEIDPEQLSGGERALFNLSLRCAIYRLLGEGVEGAAPMPPLILDEPTVFLDSGHVRQLVALVDAMRDLGVEQILVVSHDDTLVDAAATVVRVEKDPTTNRSTVEREALVLSGD
jgi:exonuclease SbcC